MTAKIRRVEYFNTTVHDRPGEAYRLLSQLAGEEVVLLAFSAVPSDSEHTQLVLFPVSTERLARAAEKNGIVLTGPQHAFLVQGDDELGALLEIHRRLTDAQVNVYASTGVTDNRGGFGYIFWVREGDFEKAAHTLGV